MTKKIPSPNMDGEKTSIDFYFSEIDDGPLLSREQEISLAKDVDAARYRYPEGHKKEGRVSFIKIWADDVTPDILNKAVRSRNKLIASNLRLVAKIAKRYQNRGCDLEDLIQEGNLGLIRGVDGYDYTKIHVDDKTGKVTNIKLSTYCTAWIHQRINRLIQNQSRTVRIPVHVQTLSVKIQKLVDEHVSRFGVRPTVDQLCDFVNESIKNTKQNTKTKDAVVQAIVSPRMRVVSLDKTNSKSDGDITLHGCVTDDGGYSFEDSVFRQELIEVVRSVMDRLTPREEKISRLRFGITEDPFRHDLNPITEEKQKQMVQKNGKK